MSTRSQDATATETPIRAEISTGNASSPSAIPEDHTPPRALILSESNPAYHDTEALARVIASHCFPVPRDSEQIEYAYAVIRAADVEHMSCAQYLTGHRKPLEQDYGPPRRLPGGRYIRFSTRAPATAQEREIAAKCLIGAIADPWHFWEFCRRSDLNTEQTRALAAFAQISDFADMRRVRGLKACAKVLGLRLEDLMTLRLWW